MVRSSRGLGERGGLFGRRGFPPRVPFLGRRSEPGFSVAVFQPLQVHSRRAITTATCLVGNRAYGHWFKERAAWSNTAGETFGKPTKRVYATTILVQVRRLCVLQWNRLYAVDFHLR